MADIHIIMIVEILGRPAEHVKETLKNHVRQLENSKNVEYLGEKITEPTLVDKNGDVYTSFAEVEFKAEDLSTVMDIVFNFMPSSLEILEPSNIKWDSQQATMFLNDLSGRLHKYDDVTKVAQIKSQQIFKQMQILQQKLMESENKTSKSTKKKTTKKKVAKKSTKKKTTKKK